MYRRRMIPMLILQAIREAGIVCVILLFVGGSVAFAQTNAETNAGIQFNFSTPGAKSLALGGAFLALADDATAAYANPAGLTILSRPEVSMEARNWGYTQVFTDRGRLAGEPTGEGVDTIAGLQNGEAEDSVTGLSFFSLVYPGKGWAVAFYRHEMANFEANFEAQGAFLNSRRSRLKPARTAMRLGIVNHGISASYSFGKDEKVRVGIGLSYYDFFIDSTTARFELTSADTFESPDFESGNERSSQIQMGEDYDWGITAGFLWKINEFWRVGGVYRQGPDFDFRAKFNPEVKAPSSFVQSDVPAGFHVPHVYGLGIAFQPTDDITIVFDYDRVEYSRLVEDLTSIFGANPTGNPELGRFAVDDAEELHLGFEYVFPQGNAPVFVRGGVWHDPDHKISFNGDNPSFQALFQPGSDEIHYSAGVGIVGRNFQVDAAFEISELVEVVSLSTVVRF